MNLVEHYYSKKFFSFTSYRKVTICQIHGSNFKFLRRPVKSLPSANFAKGVIMLGAAKDKLHFPHPVVGIQHGCSKLALLAAHRFQFSIKCKIDLFSSLISNRINFDPREAEDP